jgi:hypothetical protein
MTVAYGGAWKHGILARDQPTSVIRRASVRPLRGARAHVTRKCAVSVSNRVLRSTTLNNASSLGKALHTGPGFFFDVRLGQWPWFFDLVMP